MGQQRKTMTHLSIAGAIAGLAMSCLPATAQDTMKFGICYDLSKSYTFISPQVSQAAQDLAALTNMKGGIEGHPVEMIVQDTGNEPQRGIECYERLKQQGVFVFETLSTPVSIAVLPRITKDKNILLSPLAGRADAVDGKVFEQIFPLGPSYWAQAANIVEYIKQERGGDLKGAKIAFFYIDYPFGQEPIKMLQTIAKQEGFDLGLFPFPLPGNDQSSVWTQIRRYNPDSIIAWAFSNMHVVASREMKRNGIPTSKYISVNWLNEVDISNIGPDNAKGLRRSTPVAGGQDNPLLKEIMSSLYDKGKGAGPSKNIYDVYYNTGLMFYSIAFEGVRLAIENDGWPVTPESMKKGLESISGFDANNLIAPVTLTPQDHGGGGKTRIEEWDGGKWVPKSDWFVGYQDLVWSTVQESASTFKLD